MTAGSDLAERLGPVGLWTSHLDRQPTERVRTAVAELEALGWPSLWCWEVLGREALTNAGLLLAATGRMVLGTGIANIWARDPAAMANAQRTLAEAYPDRFVLGVGVSHGPWSTPAVTATSGRWPRCAPTSTPWTPSPGRDRRSRSSRRGCWPPSGRGCWRWPRSAPPAP